MPYGPDHFDCHIHAVADRLLPYLIAFRSCKRIGEPGFDKALQDTRDVAVFLARLALAPGDFDQE